MENLLLRGFLYPSSLLKARTVVARAAEAALMAETLAAGVCNERVARRRNILGGRGMDARADRVDKLAQERERENRSEHKTTRRREPKHACMHERRWSGERQYLWVGAVRFGCGGCEGEGFFGAWVLGAARSKSLLGFAAPSPFSPLHLLALRTLPFDWIYRSSQADSKPADPHRSDRLDVCGNSTRSKRTRPLTSVCSTSRGWADPLVWPSTSASTTDSICNTLQPKKRHTEYLDYI